MKKETNAGMNIIGKHTGEMADSINREEDDEIKARRRGRRG
jgi:hypothetical protein